MWSSVLENAVRDVMQKPQHDRTRRDKVLAQLVHQDWTPAPKLAAHNCGALGYRSRITELRREGIAVTCRELPRNPKKPQERHCVFGLTEIVGGGGQ